MNADNTYPALMTYIHSRTASADWFGQLRDDEAAARGGAFSDVVAEMAQAKADYAAAAAPGRNTFPYNSAMGEFLGLPLKANNEPARGYYMANCVASHHALGAAQREVAALVAEGKPIRITIARAKRDGKPLRFAVFSGEQIKIGFDSVECCDSKRRVRLSSNWSTESCLQAVAKALREGTPYGR